MSRLPGLPLLLAGLALALQACDPGPRLREPPPSLAGVALHHTVTGGRALDALRYMHRGGGGALLEAWVAHYGDAPSAILYVGVTGSAESAGQLMEAMRTRIGEGETPFQAIGTLRLFGTDLYTMRGQGQVHFTYPDGSQVVWLSVDPALACRALAEVLRAKGDEGIQGCQEQVGRLLSPPGP